MDRELHESSRNKRNNSGLLNNYHSISAEYINQKKFLMYFTSDFCYFYSYFSV